MTGESASQTVMPSVRKRNSPGRYCTRLSVLRFCQRIRISAGWVIETTVVAFFYVIADGYCRYHISSLHAVFRAYLLVIDGATRDEIAFDLDVVT